MMIMKKKTKAKPGNGGSSVMNATAKATEAQKEGRSRSPPISALIRTQT